MASDTLSTQKTPLQLNEKTTPMYLTEEEVDRVLEGTTLKRRATLRKSLVAVFSGEDQSIANKFKITRNEDAHTAAALDLALWLALHRQKLLVVMDDAARELMSEEEIERVMDDTNLDREAVRPRLAAVFANGRKSIASDWNLRRNRVAHTAAAIDVALYLKLHRENVLRIMDDATYRLIYKLFPKVYGVSPDSVSVRDMPSARVPSDRSLSTLSRSSTGRANAALSLSEGRRYASIRRLAEPWPRLTGLVQEEENVQRS